MGKLVKDMTPEEIERIRAYQAAYYAAHREEKRACQAAYRAAHLEEIRAYQDAYRAAHREEKRACQAAYYAAYREERRAYQASYRADAKTHRANARMSRLGFAFADPNAIVESISNAVNNRQTKKRKVA